MTVSDVLYMWSDFLHVLRHGTVMHFRNLRFLTSAEHETSASVRSDGASGILSASATCLPPRVMYHP